MQRTCWNIFHILLYEYVLEQYVKCSKWMPSFCRSAFRTKPSVNTQLRVKSWFCCTEVCCHILLYCDIFGSHCQLVIVSGAVCDLVTVVVCELVVWLQTSLYWPSCLLFSIGLRSTWRWKFRFWRHGLRSLSALCRWPCLSFHFFQMFFPDLLISLCFSVSCTAFSNCIAVNHVCKRNQDLAN